LPFSPVTRSSFFFSLSPWSHIDERFHRQATSTSSAVSTTSSSLASPGPSLTKPRAAAAHSTKRRLLLFLPPSYLHVVVFVAGSRTPAPPSLPSPVVPLCCPPLNQQPAPSAPREAPASSFPSPASPTSLDVVVASRSSPRVVNPGSYFAPVACGLPPNQQPAPSARQHPREAPASSFPSPTRRRTSLGVVIFVAVWSPGREPRLLLRSRHQEQPPPTAPSQQPLPGRLVPVVSPVAPRTPPAPGAAMLVAGGRSSSLQLARTYQL
jgi:hypothetical protein